MLYLYRGQSLIAVYKSWSNCAKNTSMFSAFHVATLQMNLEEEKDEGEEEDEHSGLDPEGKNIAFMLSSDMFYDFRHFMNPAMFTAFSIKFLHLRLLK